MGASGSRLPVPFPPPSPTIREKSDGRDVSRSVASHVEMEARGGGRSGRRVPEPLEQRGLASPRRGPGSRAGEGRIELIPSIPVARSEEWPLVDRAASRFQALFLVFDRPISHRDTI